MIQQAKDQQQQAQIPKARQLIADPSMMVPVAGQVRRTWAERLKSKPLMTHRAGVVYIPDPNPRESGDVVYMHPATINAHNNKIVQALRRVHERAGAK